MQRLIDTGTPESQESLPYGPQAIGRMVFTADKRVMVAICDGRPTLPAGTTREYGGYCGDYAFDGATLTTQVMPRPIRRWLAHASPRTDLGACQCDPGPLL